ncbi:MAG: MBG domain-containing protein, partial [Pseudomonadota bacterium]
KFDLSSLSRPIKSVDLAVYVTYVQDAEASFRWWGSNDDGWSENSWIPSKDYVPEQPTFTPQTADQWFRIPVTEFIKEQKALDGTASLILGKDADDAVFAFYDRSYGEQYASRLEVTYLSNNADLSALVISEGTLTPVFDAGTTDYSATVSNGAEFRVTPTVADSNATVTVDGTAVASGTASSVLDLAEGDNTVPVVVTAEDGTAQKEYVITVTRKAAQTITFDALPTASYGQSFDAGATASSGLTVTYQSSDTSVATVSGSTVTPVGVGSATITASQAGNDNYEPAPDVSRELVVEPANATVTLSSLASTYDGSPKPISVATDPAGLALNVTYDGSGTPPTAAGNYTVVATITEPNYQGEATGVLSISKAAANVTLSQLQATYDGSPKPAGAAT